MEQKITFITLGVNNIEESINFYENIFGWKRDAMSNDKLIVYKVNGILLSLYSRNALAKDACVPAIGNGFKGFSISYNVTSEQEVDMLMNELKNKKVKIVKHPEKVFWGGYSGYIADPDNNLWEIAYNPFL